VRCIVLPHRRTAVARHVPRRRPRWWCEASGCAAERSAAPRSQLLAAPAWRGAEGW